MDLTSLAWPTKNKESEGSVFCIEKNRGGLGGTVISASRQAPKYKKFGGCLQTEFEITGKKIEKIERPLLPQKEKEQRDREPPRRLR